jgi:hypothetical protein
MSSNPEPYFEFFDARRPDDALTRRNPNNVSFAVLPELQLLSNGDHYRGHVEQHADNAEIDELWADVLQSGRVKYPYHV